MIKRIVDNLCIFCIVFLFILLTISCIIIAITDADLRICIATGILGLINIILIALTKFFEIRKKENENESVNCHRHAE